MKLAVNILENELCSSKARVNFNRNKIGHVVKLTCFSYSKVILFLIASDWYSPIIVTRSNVFCI